MPYEDSGPQAAKLLQNSTLKTYKDLPHGSHATHPDLINADFLAFIRGETVGAESEGAPARAAEPVTAE